MLKILNPLLKIFILTVVFASGTSAFADTLYSQIDGNNSFNPPDSPNPYNFTTASFTGNSSSTQPIYVTYWLKIPDLSAESVILRISENCDIPKYINSSTNPEFLDGQFHKITYQTTLSVSPSYCQTTIYPYVQNAYLYPDLEFRVDSSDNPYLVVSTIPNDPIIDLNTDTRITYLNPENNEVYSIATSSASTTISYGMGYYINESDIGQSFSVQVFLKNYDQNILFGRLSDNQVEFLDFVATSSGYFDTEIYHLDLPRGNYMIKGQLKKSLWGFTLPKIGVFDEVENQFIVGSSTYIGALVQGSRNALNGALASTSPMSFASSSNTCNPFSGSVSTLYFNTEFSPIACTAFLFVPDEILISESLTNVRVNVLQSFPIGYITDFITIMATTSTSTLTVIDATLPSILPGGGARVQLNLSHVLDWALYATSSRYNNVSASSTKTLFEITNDYWKIVVYIGALLYILSRLLGTRLIPTSLLDHNKNKKI